MLAIPVYFIQMTACVYITFHGLISLGNWVPIFYLVIITQPKNDMANFTQEQGDENHPINRVIVTQKQGDEESSHKQGDCHPETG